MKPVVDPIIKFDNIDGSRSCTINKQMTSISLYHIGCLARGRNVFFVNIQAIKTPLFISNFSRSEKLLMAGIGAAD